MAPRRSRVPTKAQDMQIITYQPEDSIEVDSNIDPQLLTQPPTPSQPSTPSEDQSDRIEWLAEMIHVLFSELLDQAQDGKRADSRFKKEAWEAVLQEVRLVYTGSIPPPPFTEG